MRFPDFAPLPPWPFPLPAVELEDPPMNIRTSINIITGTAKVAVSTEANPAVLFII